MVTTYDTACFYTVKVMTVLPYLVRVVFPPHGKGVAFHKEGRMNGI